MIPQIKYNSSLSPTENLMAWQNVINTVLRDIYVGQVHDDKIHAEKQLSDIQTAFVETEYRWNYASSANHSNR